MERLLDCGIGKLTIQSDLFRLTDLPRGNLDHSGSQNAQNIDKNTPAGRKCRNRGGMPATHAGLEMACFAISFRFLKTFSDKKRYVPLAEHATDTTMLATHKQPRALQTQIPPCRRSGLRLSGSAASGVW